jgi:hypothetical protein
MTQYLSIYAGEKATRLIREQGLKADMVEVVAGAAGGPKWLVLCGLDRAIFSSWLFDRKKPVYFVGSSAGTWRLGALAQGMADYGKLLDAYVHQTYETIPDARMVSHEIRKILDSYLDNAGIGKILNHNYARLNVLSTKCRWPCSVERNYPLIAAMVMGGILNLISRKLLRLFFSRTLFFDPRDKPPFLNMEGFPIQRVPLTHENLPQVMMASGAMPVLIEGVKDIPGALPGVYRDAGIIDYHVNIPFNSNSIVLYPHYMERITPGWFDKMLFWRKPKKRDLDNVVLLCPGKAFVEKLPNRKIPSREDFKNYWKRDAERISYWQQVIAASAVLGEEFLEAIENNRIVHNIKPIDILCSE